MVAPRDLVLGLLLVGAALGTVAVHAVALPAAIPDRGGRAIVYLAAGWATFATAWYAAGRLFASPGELPRMRDADVGAALFLVSFFVSAGLDAWGLTPERTPIVHALPAVGIYLGLALVGWAVGRRSRAIDRTARSEA